MSADLRAAVRLALLTAIPVDRPVRLDDIDQATDGVLALIDERTPPEPAEATEVHVAVLSGGAWQLEHPARCQAGDCDVLDLLDAIPAPAYGAGRWAVTVVDGALALGPTGPA